MSVRRRSSSAYAYGKPHNYVGIYAGNGSVVADKTIVHNIVVSQTTDSTGHPYRELNGTNGNIGGNFYSVNQEYEGVASPERVYRAGWVGSNYSYDGTFLAYSGSAAFPGSNGSSQLTLWGLGSTAVARCTPTSPVAGVSTFVGELHEGLPHVIGSSALRERVMRARKGRTRSSSSKVGDEYLNAEFGWKPLLSDVTKFATAVKKSHKVLTQYERDSGRRVRRRYYFPSISSSEVQDLGLGQTVPALDTRFYSNSVYRFPLTRTVTTQIDRWFSGAFTYYLNMGDSARDRLERHAQEANKLLGTRLTPEVLWELAPWSWAADWVSNVGDIAHNVSAFSNDGLVMQYGYVMERASIAHTYELKGVRMVDRPSDVLNLSQTFRTVTKQRQAASPYGFGINESSFTGRQVAIVAALGLARRR